ncbi:MAG TPA: right-handed parallel beta-helix repeat-containing protein [Candidatus Binatia bacterium]|jgi:hypothetical protein|nr:right-handed parallel beta-helix repeat-containing protein [Candidatus Binatia bacterium]
MISPKRLLLDAAACCLLANLPSALAQGSLTPPGPPAPTMKSLDQLQPRTPISALPFTITNRGSYFLAANLTGVSGQNGITINTNDVFLDLNGFALVGGGGGSIAIYAPNLVTNLSVAGGTIRNWDGGGVIAFGSFSARVETVLLTQNGGAGGVRLGNGSFVSHCSATGNSAPPIWLLGSGIVSDCVVHENPATGIVIGSGCTVKDCVAFFNNGLGVSSGDGCSLLHCTVYQNSTNGIAVGYASTVLECVSYGNTGLGIVAADGGIVKNCVVRGNQAGGISIGSEATVSGCDISRNSNNGLSIGSTCRIVDNAIILNGSSGILNATNAIRSRIDGNMVNANTTGMTVYNSLIIRNSVGGNSTSFAGTGNDIGPTSSGAATSTSPWANF